MAEAVIIDWNSKEHLQNEVNEKELPQLKKHFTKKYKGTWQKSFNLLPSKTFIQIMHVYFVHPINPLENMLF